jgi:hypothetical protein
MRSKATNNVSNERQLPLDSLQQSVEERFGEEERLARELLHYFTGFYPSGVNYDDQPRDVKNLWLGAARGALKAVHEGPG